MNKQLVKNYQYWNGLNEFYCGGKIMLGPKGLKAFTFTWMMINLPASIPDVNAVLPLLTISLIAYIISNIFVFLTGMTDPGYLLKNDNYYKTKNTKNLFKPMVLVIKQGVIKKMNFCNTCKIYRPPYTSHCRICNNCVENFDHHCQWVGTCVGKRNYRHYVYFLLFLFFLQLIAFIVSIISLSYSISRIDAENDNKGWSDIANIIVTLVNLIYIIASSVVVFKLLLYHYGIILKNLTTYQDVKRNYINDIEYFFVNKLKRSKSLLFSRLFKSTHKAYFNPAGVYKSKMIIFNSDDDRKMFNSDAYVNNDKYPSSNIGKENYIPLNKQEIIINSATSRENHEIFNRNMERRNANELDVKLDFKKSHLNIIEYDRLRRYKDPDSLSSDEEICENIDVDSEIIKHETRINKILSQLDQKHLDNQNIISIKSSSVSIPNKDNSDGECEDWELLQDIPLHLQSDRNTINMTKKRTNKYSLQLNKFNTNHIIKNIEDSNNNDNLCHSNEENLINLQFSHRTPHNRSRSKDSQFDSIRMQIEIDCSKEKIYNKPFTDRISYTNEKRKNLM